jgi:voltage-gated potassium channel
MNQEDVSRSLSTQRMSLVRRLEAALDRPLALLGLVWLILLITELTGRLSPFLARVALIIWAVFLIEFLIKLILSPRKLRYLRRNWLTALSLAVPALRAFRLARAFRVVRVVRGARLLRLLASWNRSARALAITLRRRGFGYVLVLTLLVLLSGAAGMYAFERDAPGSLLNDYGTSLWWTAMILTTMGSEYWPKTAEGRLLCLMLALYGFTVFGYVTATLASYFMARDMLPQKRS